MPRFWINAPVKAAGLAVLVSLTVGGRSFGAAGSAPVTPSLIPYIDEHIHIDEHDPEGSLKALLSSLKALNGSKIFVLTEPYGPDNPERWDVEKIAAAVKKYPGTFALMGGGGSLNPMLVESARSGDAGPDIQKKFKDRAEELLRKGIIAFGEMSNEHLSVAASPLKDYEYVPADHPLLLLLADIAAEHNVPIVLHMEAVPETMTTPPEFGPPNPPKLQGNIAPFERLLAHNPKARIVWAHAGADNTGFRTPDLCRRLLAAHANLYMEIKFDPTFPAKNPPIVNGKIDPAWLKLYEDFPDRFVIGSDQHWAASSPVNPPRTQANVLLLNQLPENIRQKIAGENALKIFPAAAKSP